MTDRVDDELLALLREDARRPVTQLAAILGISRATVQARIDRLRVSGRILGFTLRLPASEGRGRVRAIAMLAVSGEAIEKVPRALQRLPDVVAVYSTNGRWDLIAELDSADLVSFDEALGRIRKIDGVVATETSLKLARVAG